MTTLSRFFRNAWWLLLDRSWNLRHLAGRLFLDLLDFLNRLMDTFC